MPDGMPDRLADLRSAIDYYTAVHATKCSNAVQVEMRRQLARNDLFYLLVYILNRHDLLHPWLFDRAREIQEHPDGCIDLWAREHYKTTAISIGLTIQDILKDPEVTIGIFSHTRNGAKTILKQIKREFESNDLLRSLFPDILWSNPSRESPTWSEDAGIIVKRKSNPKEATIEGWGLVDGQPIGRHFRLRVYDDVVTPESVSTPDQIQKTTEAFELSDNLGTIGGKVRIIGTRYHLHDTYAKILERGSAKPRLYPATGNGRMDGTPVYFTQAEWDRRKRTQSRRIVASQLLQNPMADEEASFRMEWLKPYEVRPRTLNIGITCDPSKGRNPDSDRTAIAVIGLSAQGGKYLLDGYCHRMSLSQRWVAIRDLYKKWSNTSGVARIQVGYELYGQQSDDEYFQERMRAEKIFFTIDELNWVREGSQSKKDRVERLEPDFRNSRFFLPLAIFHDGQPSTWSIDTTEGSPTFGNVLWREVEGFTRAQRESIDAGSPDLVAKAVKRVNEDGRIYDLTDLFIQEYSFFPFGEYKDLLDASSRFVDLEMLPPKIVKPHQTEPPQFHDS